ncbi:MAG TPA: tetratricopeptide repeat protein, partial [Burkholderiales bacterium]|nr:tetratricopeptide repeat protein [Burkholderiales bacterium]
MSLINQMLQDLAQRQAPSNGAPSQIHPLGSPRKPKNRPLWIGLILMALLNIATLAWFVHHGSVRGIPPGPSKTAVVKPVELVISHAVTPRPPAPVHPPRVQAVALAPAPAVSGTAVPLPAPAAKTGDPVAPDIISNANASAATLPAPAAPVGSGKAPAVAAGIPASAPATIPPTEPTPVAPPANGSIAIHKQTKPLTPAQLAQNEYISALNLARQGDMQGAIDGFTRVLALDPRHHQARLMLSGLLIESKRFNEAETLLQTGLMQDPAQIDFATLLARLQVEHDSLDASIATLTRSLPYAANQADYQAFLAALLQRS